MTLIYNILDDLRNFFYGIGAVVFQPLHTITFTITGKCNLSYPICCFSCNPMRDEILDDAIIERAIKSLEKEKRVRCIAISGGEPMLYPNKVIKIVRWASAAGKEAAIYTNGFWCQTFDKTRKLLLDLKTAGLNLVLISVDAFHQKYVAVKNILCLLQACRDLGIAVRIHSALTHSTLETTDTILHWVNINLVCQLHKVLLFQ